MQRIRNRDVNILGDQRDKDLSPEMRRRDKIQRVNEESQSVSLRPSRVVISETSTAADSQDRIRVMKTQMRSRWEIFEETEETGEVGRRSRRRTGERIK